jgi:hypothetical protein
VISKDRFRASPHDFLEAQRQIAGQPSRPSETIHRNRVAKPNEEERFLRSRLVKILMAGRMRTFGTVGGDNQKQMSGLEFVQGLASGALPLNTFAEALGYEIAEVTVGRVVVSATPNGTHLNPWGSVHGGFTATLLDSCMGLAIHSTLERGIGSTTLEFKISLLRPIMLRSPRWDG